MPTQKPTPPGNNRPSDTTRARRPSRLKRVLFACVTLLTVFTLLAFAVELLLTVLAPQPLLPRYVTDSGFGIRVHSANISIRHTTADYRISVRTNSLGIRTDREFTQAKPEGVYRIVGLGDSFTFGYGVEVEETYLARLERLLHAAGINAEVINLGVSGHGTAEQLILLNERGLAFDPDLVIVGYYNNDIGDNTRAMLYVLGEGDALVRKKPSYLPGVAIREFLYSFGIYRFLAERSQLLYLIRGTLSDLVQKQLRKRHVTAEALDLQKEGRLTARLLDEIKRTCRSRNVDFCLLEIPSSTIWSNLPRTYATEIDESDIVDLRVALGAGAERELMYWQHSDGHWTPAAHDIAATELFERVMTLPSIRDRRR